MEIVTSDHIKFAPDMLVRLGEELIPNPDQGIIELVRNSYDADAGNCSVDLSQVEAPDRAITIRDDGVGMNLEDISNGWLVLGHSGKSSRADKATSRGRLPVGDKGLGRLAGLRMGRFATLTTRPKAERNVEYSMTLDWTKFVGADLVEDVPFEITRRPTEKRQGTEIVLKDVRVRLSRREIDRLARGLILLSDPFSDSSGFRAELVAPSFRDLEHKVRHAYFEDAEYRLEAKLDDDGRATARLLDWKGHVLHKARHDLISRDRNRSYKAVAAEFRLWVFLLSGATFSTRKTSMAEVRDWLSIVGGVHLYYRKLRVAPYGDRGHDWLEMNLARARSPEERPSTNNSIGRVIVEDPSHMLIQKTDRIGFIETEQFNELRRFAMDALDWMAKVRLREAERRRSKERLEAPKTVSKAVARLGELIEETPPRYRTRLSDAMSKLDHAVKREAQSLREDLQLYRSLATAGTTSAVFAHEAAKPISRIEDLSALIKKRALKLLGADYRTLEKPVDLLERSTRTLKSFTAIPLFLLKRSKRRAEQVNLHSVIEDVVQVFKPVLNDAKISVEVEKVDSELCILGTVALVEAILTNFITNTVRAFDREGSASVDRRMIVRTEVSGKWALLAVMDNGPGIVNIKLEEIWLPGRTTIPGGTGFGLTILRDAVTDLGGTVSVIANGEIGGAEFIVKLPLIGD